MTKDKKLIEQLCAWSVPVSKNFPIVSDLMNQAASRIALLTEPSEEDVDRVAKTRNLN